MQVIGRAGASTASEVSGSTSAVTAVEVARQKRWARARVAESVMELTMAALEETLAKTVQGRGARLNQVVLRSTGEGRNHLQQLRESEKARTMELQLLSREVISCKLKGEGRRLDHAVCNYALWLGVRPEDLNSYLLRHADDGLLTKVMISASPPGMVSRKKADEDVMCATKNELLRRFAAGVQLAMRAVRYECTWEHEIWAYSE